MKNKKVSQREVKNDNSIFKRPVPSKRALQANEDALWANKPFVGKFAKDWKKNH